MNQSSNLIEGKDYVICKLCGRHKQRLAGSHLQGVHGIGTYTYLEMFPGAEVSCENWYYHNLEHLLDAAKANESQSLTPEHCKAISEGRMGMTFSDEHRENIRRATTGNIPSRKARLKVGNSLRKYYEDHPEAVEKARQTALNYWADPEYRDRTVKAIIAGSQSPTLEEIALHFALDRYFPNQWKYTGTGELVVGGKVPDFCHTKEPLLIELFGTYWHGEDFPKAQEQDRIDHFKRFGYDTLVIWDDENTEDIVIEKVQNFLSLVESKLQ